MKTLFAAEYPQPPRDDVFTPMADELQTVLDRVVAKTTTHEDVRALMGIIVQLRVLGFNGAHS